MKREILMRRLRRNHQYRGILKTNPGYPQNKFTRRKLELINRRVSLLTPTAAPDQLYAPLASLGKLARNHLYPRRGSLLAFTRH